MQLTLKQARTRKRLSLDDLAHRTDLCKSTISRVERGLTRPTHDTVVKLEDALNLRRGSLTFPEAA
jgi:transcriptional regulator with XRE-family HTH domain